LVVLQGVHRDIPTAPVVEQSSARLLPPPPSEGGQNGQQSPKPQTEADKILQKYSAIGRQQDHVYGGYGSNLPNFNAKPGANQPTVAQPAPAPSILGARPDLPKPAIVKPESREPVLPLGAPRRRAADSAQSKDR
jgi:hypothetical protein